MSESGTRPIWLDGVFVEQADARIPVLSHAAQRGSTVFDVLKVVTTPDGPAAVGLRPHIARFSRSMDLMGMDHLHSLAELEEAVRQTVVRSPDTRVVKVVATWSEVSLGSLPASTRPQIWVATFGPDDGPVPSGDGIGLRTATAPKMPADVLPPSLKVAAAYTYGVRERMQARELGFDDVIFRTVDGDLAESTTQSIFVVRQDDLLIPPLNVVLDGITRRLVLDVAHHLHRHASVRGVFWDEVLDADELFMSSTNYPVAAVARHDDRRLPCPGPVTAQLMTEVDQLFSGDHPLARRWLTPLT